MFGLLVRTIYMNGEQPTHALPFFDLPASCPPPLTSLITSCFATMASGRPTSDDLYQSLSTLAAVLPQSASGVMVSSGSGSSSVPIGSTGAIVSSPRASLLLPRGASPKSPPGAHVSVSINGGSTATVTSSSPAK
jgi:hypothetical protein